MNNRINKIKSAIAKKPYVFYFIIVFLVYLGINILLNKTFATFSTIFSSYRISFLIPFIFLNLITAFLVATNINLMIMKFKEMKLMNNVKGSSGGIVSIGIFGGLLGGACPGCFVGLFPAFVGLFGVSMTLGNLPLHGLEIQIVSSLILVLSLFLLTRENKCKIKQ